MTMLAVALPWTTALSINLRCATPLLPIAIDRPSPPLHRPLPNEAVNAPQQQTASAEIPIASDAPLRHISRGFSLGGLRTPAPLRVAPSSWAGIRKPSQTATL